MTTRSICDALNYIEDDFLLETDELRRKSTSNRRFYYKKVLPAVACLCIIIGTCFAVSPLFRNNTSPSPNPSPNKDSSGIVNITQSTTESTVASSKKEKTSPTKGKENPTSPTTVRETSPYTTAPMATKAQNPVATEKPEREITTSPKTANKDIEVSRGNGYTKNSADGAFSTGGDKAPISLSKNVEIKEVDRKTVLKENKNSVTADGAMATTGNALENEKRALRRNSIIVRGEVSSVTYYETDIKGQKFFMVVDVDVLSSIKGDCTVGDTIEIYMPLNNEAYNETYFNRIKVGRKGIFMPYECSENAGLYDNGDGFLCYRDYSDYRYNVFKNSIFLSTSDGIVYDNYIFRGLEKENPKNLIDVEKYIKKLI